MTLDEVGRIVVDEDELQHVSPSSARRSPPTTTGRPPLLVGVLKGAFMFMSDLARAIDLPVEFDFMAVSSYGSATRTSGVVRIIKDLDLDLTDRHVLIVEDIVDSGLTLAYLRKNLAAREPGVARGVRAARKEGLQQVEPDLKYVGFTHPARRSSSATASTSPSGTATCPTSPSTSAVLTRPQSTAYRPERASRRAGSLVSSDCLADPECL